MASFHELPLEVAVSIPPAYNFNVSYDLLQKPPSTASSNQNTSQFGFAEPSETWYEKKSYEKDTTDGNFKFKLLVFLRYFPFYIRVLAMLTMAVSSSFILTAVVMYENALRDPQGLENFETGVPIRDDRCIVFLFIAGINLVLSCVFLIVTSSSSKLQKSQRVLNIAFAIIGATGFGSSMGACLYLNKESKLQDELWKWSCMNEKLGLTSDALDFHSICQNVSVGWKFGLLQASLDLLTLVTSISAFLLLKYGNFVRYGRIGKNNNIKRQSSPIQDGSLPVRRNILEFQNDRVSWSLYIQALANLQNKPDDDNFSYFRLSGIHGRPYTQWNDSPKTPGSHDTGYCTHNTVLFLPWHRPYLSAFEQKLIAEAQNVAKSYVNRPEYMTAANNLRMPYWDWAAIPKLPDVVSQPTVQIDSPTGTLAVENPLYRFKFPAPLDPKLFPSNSGDGWLSKYPQTVRGASSTNPNEAGDPAAVDGSLQNSRLTSDTWRSLMKSTDFNGFGSTGTPGTSIENIHNSLHSYVGARYGHMSYLSYAAYDPIFWLHHANVDRLFALWQVLNPDSYIESQEYEYGNYVIPPNSIVDANTPLQPFRNQANNQWWTSESSRHISTFSYTYPELQGSQTPEQLKANVTAAINTLYNPSNAAGRRLIQGVSEQDTTTREWSVALSVSKFDVGGERFKVLFFLNGVPVSPDDWDSSKTLAGFAAIFPPPHSFENITSIKLLTYSEVDLVDSLEQNGLDVNDVPSVVDFLKNKLEWRVQKMDGTVVPLEQVQTLSLTIQDEIVTIPSDITQPPIYGEKTIHPDALRS
ncbi:hypothetical protein K3495_g1516 [Podosphaera aphanis]|nr:hypothetical protein K3495_g1516 [Podosphaera aphanis]